MTASNNIPDVIKKQNYYDIGYLGEKLAICSFNESMGEIIDYDFDNISKGIEYYRVYRGSGLDFAFKVKGYKYRVLGEVKNINSNHYLSIPWFMKEHELRFPANKYGGEVFILIVTGRISGDTKKWLKSKGIEVWQLSEQVTMANFEKMKSELISKYIRPLLFRLKNVISKYNKVSNCSIADSSITLIDTYIKSTYVIDNVYNRRNNINKIELSNKEINRLKEKYKIEKNRGFAVKTLPDGGIIFNLDYWR
jgi:hypothetical protein